MSFGTNALAMSNLHCHFDDLPKLHGNMLYKCPSCIHGKMQHHYLLTKTTGSGSPSVPLVDTMIASLPLTMSDAAQEIIQVHMYWYLAMNVKLFLLLS